MPKHPFYFHQKIQKDSQKKDLVFSHSYLTFGLSNEIDKSDYLYFRILSNHVDEFGHEKIANEYLLNYF